jgi:hypothetical protein
MNRVILLLVLTFSAAFTAASAQADAPIVSIRLNGQLWARPLGKRSVLDFRRIGNGVLVSAELEESGPLSKYITHIDSREVSAALTFLWVPATSNERSFIVTQVRLFNTATGTLIAECANYDSIVGERAPGVGVCSGVIGDTQFGLTLARAGH